MEVSKDDEMVLGHSGRNITFISHLRLTSQQGYI